MNNWFLNLIIYSWFIFFPKKFVKDLNFIAFKGHKCSGFKWFKFILNRRLDDGGCWSMQSITSMELGLPIFICTYVCPYWWNPLVEIKYRRDCIMQWIIGGIWKSELRKNSSILASDFHGLECETAQLFHIVRIGKQIKLMSDTMVGNCWYMPAC